MAKAKPEQAKPKKAKRPVKRDAAQRSSGSRSKPVAQPSQASPPPVHDASTAEDKSEPDFINPYNQAIPEMDWSQFGLNERQRRFVEEYLIDPNATQAYIRAGFCPKGANANAARLIAKDSISRAIAEGNRLRSARVVCTQDWVLEKLRELVERCLVALPVFDMMGRPVFGKWTFDSKGANTALRTIGDHLQMFKKQLEHSGTLTLADLMKLAAEAEAEEGDAPH